MCLLTGTPEGSTESGFIEKPGIEPATPGLQDIGLSPTPRRLPSLHLIKIAYVLTLTSRYPGIKFQKTIRQLWRLTYARITSQEIMDKI